MLVATEVAGAFTEGWEHTHTDTHTHTGISHYATGAQPSQKTHTSYPDMHTHTHTHTHIYIYTQAHCRTEKSLSQINPMVPLAIGVEGGRVKRWDRCGQLCECARV